MKGRKMLSNSEVAVFCEQSGMILESGLSMLEGISIMEEDVEPHNTEYKKMYEDMRMCLEETGIFHYKLLLLRILQVLWYGIQRLHPMPVCV